MQTLSSRLGLLTALFALLPTILVGQGRNPDGDMLDIYSFGDDYFLETVTMPGSTPNRGKIIVLVRLTHNLLTFRKVPTRSSGTDLYQATPTIYVEAQDEEGVIVDYDMWSDTVSVPSYRETVSRRILAPGWVELDVRPGTYVISYTIDDGSPSGRFTRKTEPVIVPDYSVGNITFGSPLLLNEVHEEYVVPAAIDGNAEFGRPLQMFVPLHSESPVHNVRYDLYRVDEEGMISENLTTGNATLLGRIVPGRIEAEGSLHRIYLENDPLSSDIWGGIISYRGGELGPGDYAIELSGESETGSASDTLFFSLKWVDRPFALTDPTYAIRVLEPIATDEEIDKLLSVGKEKREDALWNYWKRNDPTPETYYNERMAEYYRRVDYARFNYASIGVEDGVYTDRGKIYILYGPPTGVSRELDPDEHPREIWMYQNLVNRKFIFSDPKESGNYRLIEYYDL